ncbi:MAG: class I SAM-dependent methyltransferase, partial [Pseudomonadota bacterium]
MKTFLKYAEYYDIFYHDKDYEAESDFLEVIFTKYSERPAKRILDLGCGTGGHSIPLSCRGYHVIGVDRSQEMLRQARVKADSKKCEIPFLCDDIRGLRLSQTFDAVSVLFNVAGYQATSEDMHKMLETVDLHLERSGTFVFDFWYGPSVMAENPQARLKEILSGDLSVLRFADPRLHAQTNCVEINYRILCIRGRTVIADIKEKHH